MTGTSRRSGIGIFIAVLILAFCASPQFRDVYQFPPHLRIMEDETASLSVGFPFTMTVNHQQTLRLESTSGRIALTRPVSIQPLHLGNATVEFRFLGLIPVRTVEVDVLPSLRLIPGGHSIGVVLHSQGVIVVGHSPILTGDGQDYTPAKDAGIAVGDVIMAINGIPAQSDIKVAETIDNSGREGHTVDLLVKRGEQTVSISVSPILCSETRRYRIGLFIRDSAAGVGTLTFYEPKTNTYGALGHIITDGDTNQPIDCNRGKIVLATVSGIQQGKRGQPGEKIGVFIEEDRVLGDIRKNCQFGIYGELTAGVPNTLYSEAVPVASMSQVQLGPAEMLTVVDGQTIEKFSIEIQRINLQDAPEGKGMVIKVTDPRLLEKTGGIVQGMSGSPIMQNGKIVGAVTHVFVHDPAKGYGCFVDWMLMESGLLPKRESQAVRKLFTIDRRHRPDAA
jgi:stage IV sporulation protein B